MEAVASPPITRHKLTVEQYHRMGEAGIFAPDARVELIEGEVIDMAPMGTRHFSVVSRLTRLLVGAVGDTAVVNAQLPAHLGHRSEPEPDLSILLPRDDFYAPALPTAADTLLLIEVSDTTLDYDLRVKARLYARHGIPAYWVFDLAAGLLHVHTQPHAEGWLSVVAQRSPGVMSLPGLDGGTVDLSGVL